MQTIGQRGITVNDVPVSTAIEEVPAAAAQQVVRAAATADLIGILAAAGYIVTGTAVQDVDVGGRILDLGEIETTVRRGWVQRGIEIGPGGAEQQVCAGTTEQGIGAGPALQEIVPRATLEMVFTSQPVQGVTRLVAGQVIPERATLEGPRHCAVQAAAAVVGDVGGVEANGDTGPVQPIVESGKLPVVGGGAHLARGTTEGGYLDVRYRGSRGVLVQHYAIVGAAGGSVLAGGNRTPADAGAGEYVQCATDVMQLDIGLRRITEVP